MRQKFSNVCAKCGSPMKQRTGKFGRFFGCTRYPQCTFTRGKKYTFHGAL